MSPVASVDRLLKPRSVAIVGASDRAGALGASVLSNLERFGFPGSIHLINPTRHAIGGRVCLRSVDDLPTGVDAAVLAIPRDGVLDAMRRLAARGVGAVVIFAAGFAERGVQGLAEQREIARLASENGMIVVGPNCLGIINFVDRVPLTFVEMSEPASRHKPGIAVVSQSGAMAVVLGVTLLSRELSLSYSISTGNEAVSGVEDFVERLIEDPYTRVIAMIVEHFRSPQRFLSAARRARAAGKTIVLLHPGRSSAARESAATHTGALAGDHDVMRVLVERSGVILANSLEELGDIAEVSFRGPAFGMGEVAVLGESGAFKALMLDLADQVELPLLPLTDADAPDLRAAMPDFVDVSNPLDLTAQGLVDPDLYRRVLKVLLEDGRVGAVLVGLIQTDAVTCRIKYPPIIAALAPEEQLKPLIVAGLDEGAPGFEPYLHGMRGRGVSYFPTPERALRALAPVREIARRGDRVAHPAEPVHQPAFASLTGIVPEYRAKSLLAPLGFAFPAGRLATTLAEAQAIAAEIGYPVAIKAQAADLSHKSDAGGVVLGLGDADALAIGWARLQANVSANRVGLVLEGVLIESMVEPGVELILGGRNDPDWGPVLLVGFGGVHAELLKDVRQLAPDLEEDEVAAEFDRLNGAPLLHGFRGSPSLDVTAAARMVVLLGRLLAGEPRIREIDFNPVLLRPEGEGVLALDAVLTLGSR